MIFLIDRKRRRRFDWIIFAQFVLYAAFLVWITGTQLSLLRIIQFILCFWLLGIITKGYQLLQYMASVDVDLTNYVNSPSIQLPFKYKEWKKYLKQSRNIYLKLIPIVQLILIICTISFHIPINIFKNIFLLLLFIYVAIYGFTIATTIMAFIENFIIKHKGKLNDCHIRYDKKKMAHHILEGMTIGLLYALGIAYFYNIPIIHFFLHFFAVSVLLLFSKVLIGVYRDFSNAVYQVLGFKFEQITLVFEK